MKSHGVTSARQQQLSYWQEDLGNYFQKPKLQSSDLYMFKTILNALWTNWAYSKIDEASLVCGVQPFRTLCFLIVPQLEMATWKHQVLRKVIRKGRLKPRSSITSSRILPGSPIHLLLPCEPESGPSNQPNSNAAKSLFIVHIESLPQTLQLLQDHMITISSSKSQNQL